MFFNKPEKLSDAFTVIWSVPRHKPPGYPKSRVVFGFFDMLGERVEFLSLLLPQCAFILPAGDVSFDATSWPVLYVRMVKNFPCIFFCFGECYSETRLGSTLL